MNLLIHFRLYRKFKCRNLSLRAYTDASGIQISNPAILGLGSLVVCELLDALQHSLTRSAYGRAYTTNMVQASCY